MTAATARAQTIATPLAPSQVPSQLPSNDGTLQRWVGPHFNAAGKYVPPHYELANKKPPFRGYFPTQMNQRAKRQRGYTEPAPDYTTPVDPADLKPIEGR